MTQGIYKIASDKEILYVGQSKNIERRLKGHKNDLSKGKHRNQYLLNCFRKNPDSFSIWDIIEEVELDDDLTLREIYWINQLQPRCNFMIPNEDERWTCVISDETKKKMSESGKLRWSKLSSEEREAISEALRGRKMSPETRARMSAAQRGKAVSDIGRMNMSNSRKAFLESLSDEERLEVLGLRRGKSSWNLGKTKHTDKRLEEIGKAISIATQGRVAHNRGKPSPIRGETKETNPGILKQSESLRNRPLVACSICGKEVKVLLRHHNKYHKDLPYE